MNFQVFFSIVFKWPHMASNASKCIPKHSPHPKTSFGSPHAPYGHTKKIFRKSILRLEISFFKLQGAQILKKTHFWAKFKGQNFFPNFILWPTTLGGESIGPNEKICRSGVWLNNCFLKKVLFCILMLKNLAKT